MGDRIVVMKDGFLLQTDEPLRLYEKPANKFVGGFIGTPPMNFMEGRLVKKDDGVYFREEKFEVKLIEDMLAELSPYLGKEIILGIRPEDIHDKLFVGEAAPENTIVATVEVVEPMGAESFLYLTTGKHSFIARVEAHSQASVNEDLELVFNMSKVHFFDKETEGNII